MQGQKSLSPNAGYFFSCPEDFSGKRCEIKSRPKLASPPPETSGDNFCDFYKC